MAGNRKERKNAPADELLRELTFASAFLERALLAHGEVVALLVGVPGLCLHLVLRVPLQRQRQRCRRLAQGESEAESSAV